MFDWISRARGIVPRVLFLGLLATTIGCGIFETTEEIADEARVVVTGNAQTPLLLVTSTKFTRFYNEEGAPVITLAFSDTASITLDVPHDEIYPIKPDRGFYVKLTNPDTLTAVVDMKVYFDGELSYERTNLSLTDASVDYNFIWENYNVVQ